MYNLFSYFTIIDNIENKKTEKKYTNLSSFKKIYNKKKHFALDIITIILNI